MKDDSFLAEVREKFERAAEREDDNRECAIDDIKFARLGEQWPEDIQKLRDEDNQPCLVINHMPSFIRQVVNEARSNRPSITVIPSDSNADKATADILSGLIRNIEVASDADIAYDTAVESAVSGGFGYFRINTAYTSDDTFDQDIVIERIADPFTVYGDPESESADGSDWNCCFIAKTMAKDDFRDEYKNAEKVDWDALGYTGLPAPWHDEENILIAEYWKREDVESQIVALSNGVVMPLDEYQERAEEFQQYGIAIVGEPRTVRSKKVTQYIVSGAEVLETVEWEGKYIPIIPVYGDEVVIEGKRHFKSLIRDAKDAQREHNYWRSQAAATIALAPKVPWIGEEGTFSVDPEKWSTANDKSWPHIEYKRGMPPPQRQSPPTPASGELQQAMSAVDDMKSIIGIYDAKLGVQSNETSGVAIRQRQRQGDIATFHFIDNLTRSIRQAGRILIDLIPKVYSTARIIRVLGEDMEPQAVAIAPPDQQQQMLQQFMQRGQQYTRIFDITAGKYDLVVKAGPSYGTQRELAQAEIVEIIRAFPDSAPVLGPMYLKNSDWPGSEEAAQRMEQMAGQSGGDQQAQGQIQQLQEQLNKLAGENQMLKMQLQNKAGELQIDQFEAMTDRQKVAVDQQKAQAQMIGNVARMRQATPTNPYGVG